MARFLLGWELGANRGHLLRLASVAKRLAARGHQVTIAAQRLTRGAELPPEVSVWQAPVWPRLLANVGALGGPLPNTLGDILVRVGLDDPEILPALVHAWEGIIAAAQPDAVMADFAPSLLVAARGRVPRLCIGSGFDTVPQQLERFPTLTGQPAVYREDQVLARMNQAMSAASLKPLTKLPEMFAAERVVTGTFAELDPYAQWRAGANAAPSVMEPIGEAGGGEEIFLYADAVLLRAASLWDGLARSALPVRVFASGASTAQQAELAKLGFAVAPGPLPFARIAERSRLAMSYGPLGFVSSALAAGLPSVVVHYDLEKSLTGQAITRMQLGGHVHAGAVQAEAFATSLRQLYHNDSFQRRARELAPGFRARLAPDHHDVAVELLEELAAA